MIDFNCDMGEGIGNEKQIMPYIHSANISCGLHAGDADSISETIKLALRHGVNIGAHSSFNDRENFGRKEMQLPLPDLYDLITRQLQWFDNIVQSYNANINHIKPHGALYNMSAKDEEYAKCIATAVKDFNPDLIVYGLSGSISITAARALGLKTKNEVFADRTYNSFGQLTSRTAANAYIDSIDALKNHVRQIITDKTIMATDGTIINVDADTLCLHGDGENAVTFASVISEMISGNAVN